MPATKVSRAGNVIEITTIDYHNKKCRARKIDGEHYMDMATGEIKMYIRNSDSRLGNLEELHKTFSTLRGLINANCLHPERIRWITLTYRENMTDTERLYSDYKKFWARYKRRWGACEYITVAEPQQRGAWHLHVIAIYPSVAPYIPNAELRECWGQGFVRVEGVTDVDNLGAYLSAYLADVQVADGEGVEKLQRDGTTKAVKKGARLSLYPRSMQIYRCSRGVKKPDVFWVEDRKTYLDYEEIVSKHKPVYERVSEFTDDEGRRHRVIKTQYNLLRC